jgi:hypothetical protein
MQVPVNSEHLQGKGNVMTDSPPKLQEKKNSGNKKKKKYFFANRSIPKKFWP